MFVSLTLLATLLYLNILVYGLGSACIGPLGAGTAAAGDPYWLETIAHQGISAFHPNPAGYQVFRNIKDFGAIGDGITDDTAAINAAISSGGRCGMGCSSSTITPALVFFPAGIYIISSPIIALYYTQLIGDPRNLPTLVAAPGFAGIAVIDADPYIPGGNGAQYYANQNNFFRSIRNFVIDISRIPSKNTGTAIHWQVSQATSLINIEFRMSTASDTAHQGIWMENGSGGFMGDLVFYGGKFGMWIGNQQFTVRNVTINNAQSAIFSLWNWGWTFQLITIKNCQVGFDLVTGGTSPSSQTTGAIAIIDASVTNTPIFVRNSSPSNGKLAGSLILNNVKLDNVPVAVGVASGTVVLSGTADSTTIAFWGQGNLFQGSNQTSTFVQGHINTGFKPSVLLDNAGNVFGKTHPQYADYSPGQFVSVRSNGAKGDGRTDDTVALRAVFDKYSGCKIIFFDAGTYVVTSNITIPAGTQVVGEAWSVIAGSGVAFQNIYSPQPVVEVGAPGSQGIMEISDIIFTTIGPAPGAIVIQWNVRQPSGQNGGAGMWDSHIRLGGTAGTQLQVSQCGRESRGGLESCGAAFLGLHLAPSSTAYLEGTWVWAADHDIDSPDSGLLNVYSARGILSHSAGPVWMIGTASEHHNLYQYSFVNAQNHYLGLIQTESPYFQPTPAPPSPFVLDAAIHDPSYPSGLTSAWAICVARSSNILIFGAGLYSFFHNYRSDCLVNSSCQSQILDVDSTSAIAIYSLSTVGTTYQVSINGRGIINQSSNPNGFSQTVTAWTRR